MAELCTRRTCTNMRAWITFGIIVLICLSAAGIWYSRQPCKKWETNQCGDYTECIEMYTNYRVCKKWRYVPLHECQRCVTR